MKEKSSSNKALASQPATANTTSSPRKSQVYRRRTSLDQHVEPRVRSSTNMVAAIQAVPSMSIETSADAMRRPPPLVVSPSNPKVSAARRSAPSVAERQRHHKQHKGLTGDGQPQSYWKRLSSLMLDQEEFEDLDNPLMSPTDPAKVTDSQWRTTQMIERLPLPSWVKQSLFDVLDFLTRKRVHFVVLILAVLMFVIAPEGMMEDVAGTFTVDEDARPGLTFFNKYNRGSTYLPRRHPVAIIPGFITGALEVWDTSMKCVRQKPFLGFRQRMFGPQMIYLILSDPQCWLDLFSMDKKTGMDRNDTKVRPDSGFTSVDFFFPGYWVWAKVLINLADIGYDPQSMAVMTYDWRLSPLKVHERDGFFYQVRNNLRFLCRKNRQRAVVISHSYGTTVALAFFRWAEQRESGFMDRHVAYYVSVGGVAMGVGKAASAMLLGDARDTLNIPWAARKILDNFISQEARYNLSRSWSCLVSMLPRGCEDAWPGLTVLPNGTSLGTRGTAELIRGECQRTGHEDCVREVSSFLETIDDLPSLPQAPNTTVACLYGVGLPAEMGYYLMSNPVKGNTETPYVGNSSVFNNNTSYGVRMSDGDDTVPLISLAYMCRAVNGWKRNVGRVVTREFNHTITGTSSLNLRGGKLSAKHVDILGNYEMLETILKIASGIDEEAVENPEADEFTYTETDTGETSTLQRRVHDRIYSDVDFIIRGKLRRCLRKKNKPIRSIENYKDAQDLV
ncbi:phospholipid:diacylglycerol acyltransferase, putative [Leishmania panamensis]|uniref:Phospholipid:diacylglycerol acyltransferase, putative n=1 Tax=Leishmania panamensis TaxID=5679 RepID=A0A088RJN7_LEIPA|nr:phospholipid:diacylglycerol acyltransferase, putative [Leishmania panamensis]AIN96020.1 phospholipid:diacylglycerol acyltransferase, putative [Leishmania panamensis]